MMCYFLILIMTLLGAVASLFLKKASGSSEWRMLLVNVNLYVGGGLYVIATLLNIYVLKYLDYTVVLPMTAITYIWTMVVSFLFLGEKITKKKMCGVGLIVLGAILIAVG